MRVDEYTYMWLCIYVIWERERERERELKDDGSEIRIWKGFLLERERGFGRDGRERNGQFGHGSVEKHRESFFFF